MSSVQVLKTDSIKVIKRKDFFSKFAQIFKELRETYDISYFSTNIIENYYKPGHRVSTFGTNEKWSDLYWDKYWNKDPVERIGHSISEKKKSSLSIWSAVDGISECSQERYRVSNSKDGFLLAFDYGHNIMENVSFGWKNLENNSLDEQIIEKINNLVRPIRDYHWMTHKEYD